MAILRLTDCPACWRINGRTMPVTDKAGHAAFSYDHAGQGFFFRADCEGDVVLVMAMSTQDVPDKTYLHFKVWTDGVEIDVTANGGADERIVRLPLAQGLAAGEHSFEVYRCNEQISGLCSLISLELEGRLLPYQAPKKDLKMTFIGDSVTSGAQLFAICGVDQGKNWQSDATRSYAFLTGRALNADFTIASRSGSYSAKDDKPDSIYWTYDYYSRMRSEILYDNAKDDVDVFVISLGANDTEPKRGFSDGQIRDNVQALIRRVRADHPNAKIVWTYGQLSDKRADVMRGAVEEAMQSDPMLYYYQYKQGNALGGFWHPTAEAHARDAQELTDFLRSIL